MPLLIDPNWSRRNRSAPSFSGYDTPRRHDISGESLLGDGPGDYGGPLTGPVSAPRISSPRGATGAPMMSSPGYSSPRPRQSLNPQLGPILQRTGQLAYKNALMNPNAQFGAPMMLPTVQQKMGPGGIPATTELPNPASVQPYDEPAQFHPGIHVPLSMLGPETGRPGPMFQQDEGGNFQSVPRMATPGPAIGTPGYVTGGAPSAPTMSGSPNLSSPSAPMMTLPNGKTVPQYEETQFAKDARFVADSARQQAANSYAQTPYEREQGRQDTYAGAVAENAASGSDDYRRLLAEHQQALRELDNLRSQAGQGQRQEDRQNFTAGENQANREFRGAEGQANRDFRGGEGQANRDAAAQRQKTGIDAGNQRSQAGLEQRALRDELGGTYRDEDDGKTYYTNYPGVPMKDAAAEARAAIKERGGQKTGAAGGAVTKPTTVPADLDAANRAFSKTENRYYRKVNGEWVAE